MPYKWLITCEIGSRLKAQSNVDNLLLSFNNYYLKMTYKSFLNV